MANESWYKFKAAFVQNAALVQSAAREEGADMPVNPKNRQELRDLLRSRKNMRDVRKLVFGSWRLRGRPPGGSSAPSERGA
jgi:hypothetical protein